MREGYSVGVWKAIKSRWNGFNSRIGFRIGNKQGCCFEWINSAGFPCIVCHSHCQRCIGRWGVEARKGRGLLEPKIHEIDKWLRARRGGGLFSGNCKHIRYVGI